MSRKEGWELGTSLHLQVQHGDMDMDMTSQRNHRNYKIKIMRKKTKRKNTLGKFILPEGIYVFCSMGSYVVLPSLYFVYLLYVTITLGTESYVEVVSKLFNFKKEAFHGNCTVT